MDIFKMFSKNACSLQGQDSLKWSWEEYYQKRKELEAEGKKVFLVDMINHPIDGSTPISNELFSQDHPKGTYFCLYCHSGGSSGYLQKQLQKELPQHNIVNIAGGIGAYQPE